MPLFLSTVRCAGSGTRKISQNDFRGILLWSRWLIHVLMRLLTGTKQWFCTGHCGAENNTYFYNLLSDIEIPVVAQKSKGGRKYFVIPSSFRYLALQNKLKGQILCPCICKPRIENRWKLMCSGFVFAPYLIRSLQKKVRLKRKGERKYLIGDRTAHRPSGQRAACRICGQVHGPFSSSSSISDLVEWFASFRAIEIWFFVQCLSSTSSSSLYFSPFPFFPSILHQPLVVVGHQLSTFLFFFSQQCKSLKLRHSVYKTGFSGQCKSSVLLISAGILFYNWSPTVQS